MNKYQESYEKLIKVPDDMPERVLNSLSKIDVGVKEQNIRNMYKEKKNYNCTRYLPIFLSFFTGLLTILVGVYTRTNVQYHMVESYTNVAVESVPSNESYMNSTDITVPSNESYTNGTDTTVPSNESYTNGTDTTVPSSESYMNSTDITVPNTTTEPVQNITYGRSDYINNILLAEFFFEPVYIDGYYTESMHIENTSYNGLYWYHNGNTYVLHFREPVNASNIMLYFLDKDILYSDFQENQWQ